MKKSELIVQLQAIEADLDVVMDVDEYVVDVHSIEINDLFGLTRIRLS